MEVHVRDDYGDVPCDNCPARCECVGCEINRGDFTDIAKLRKREKLEEANSEVSQIIHKYRKDKAR